MHEKSLASAIWRQATQLGAERELGPVEVVEVEIGPLSGVEPELLTSAFRQLTQSLGNDAELRVLSAPLIVLCENCQNESQLDEMAFRCQDCGYGLTVVRGDQLLLLSVAFAEPVTGQPDHRG